MRFDNNKTLKVGDKVKFKRQDENLKSLYEKYELSPFSNSWLDKYNESIIIKELEVYTTETGEIVRRFCLNTIDNINVFDFEIRRI